MEIQILNGIDGARQANGLAVIIDVFRAFSTACYACSNGAEMIIPVGSVDAARALKRKHPEYILMGERKARKLPGFDYGNSPADIEHVDFTGRTIVHTTHAGTQGLVNATASRQVITGSFTNAEAIVNYVQQQGPERVTLVAMGFEGVHPAEEDTRCAEYLRDRLQGRTPPFQPIRDSLRECDAAAKFFDPLMDWAPERDFDLCVDLNRFSFVLCMAPDQDGRICLRRRDPSMKEDPARDVRPEMQPLKTGGLVVMSQR